MVVVVICVGVVPAVSVCSKMPAVAMSVVPERENELNKFPLASSKETEKFTSAIVCPRVLCAAANQANASIVAATNSCPSADDAAATNRRQIISELRSAWLVATTTTTSSPSSSAAGY